VKPGDGYFWRDSLWYNYRGIDYSPAMEEGARLFGWKDKWKGWLRPTAINGSKRRGIGVGVHGNADIGEDVEEAWVHIDTNGSVMLHSSLSEHGTGQRSNAVKCVAEVLQVPYETVSIIPADPSLAPVSFGPIGSRGTYAVLSAVISAAEDVRRKLLALAAPMLKAAADELATLDRYIWHINHPEKRVSWKDVIGLRSIMGEGRFDFDHTLSNCMMSFVEVEVDTDTGKVELLQVVNATDAGRIIDPQGLQGQMYGCLGTAGIDSALFEETVLDPLTGRVLNANLVDYKWRTSAELPPIENIVFETPMNSHRFHAVGVGEIATSPGPSAVLMAAANAIGRWLYEYPVTPERVVAALGKTSDDKGCVIYAAL